MNKHPTGDDEQKWSITGLVKESALFVFNTVTSKTALRTYLSTLLFFWLTLGLLGVSTIAYWVFYNRYIPQPRIEREVFLQFGDASHPHGTVFLPPSSISSLTPYDISISLHLPRTPTNLAVGNFMLDVSLHGPSDRETNSRPSTLFPSTSSSSNSKPLAHARRPAILTYTSPVVNTASTFSWLPLYLVGWSTESERLKTPIFEGLEFDRGIENLPQSIDVVLEAYRYYHHNEEERITKKEVRAQAMQVYDCRINIVAKLGGLKWIMYNHRIVSYVVFTGTFWAASVTSFLVSYFIVTMLFGSSSEEHVDDEEYIKREELKAHTGQQTLTDTGSEKQTTYTGKREQGGLSDTPRTFPSLGRRTGSGLGALRYSSPNSSAVIKKEEEEGDREEDMMQSTILQPLEADDEDDDEDGGLGRGGTESFRDSGIGTGRDDERRGERGEGVQQQQQQRRRRKGGFGGGGE